jgi:predicted Rossmann fold nucleotide-binding protein DprA/Smf involved in DNA uptake
LNALQHEPLQAEQLVELSGAPVGDALDALSSLELSGKVQREQGGHYRLVATGLFR